ncbi:hypothetical protein [Capnocytophaga sp.]|uniref:hypothetical protein n=1 Tax=Capnocytophaga sp. TaxID=44737 RepID=UPI0026DBBE66|nr:hypothetical protein [Capnocytophaga sp.]MDO5105503.1 hypothetical protein [Capnocytophaga sp.]
MKRYIIKLLLIIGIFISFQGSCTKPEIERVTEKTKTLKHNYIIINSVDGSPAEVEISYSVFVVGNTENIVKTETLTTPFVIGGEEVTVVYDSLTIGYRPNEKRHLHNLLKRNYNPKGADYLSVKNLSNTELEYCVIGNQSIQYHSVADVKLIFSNTNEIDITRVVKSSPSPIYKDTPVLYLIKPELAPQTDVYTQKNNPKIAEKISLKTPYFGQVVAHTPYSVSQIIDLYKQEYNYSNVLYFSYYVQYVEKNSANSGKNEIKHYGKIPAGQTLTNSGQVWFINTRQG